MTKVCGSRNIDFVYEIKRKNEGCSTIVRKGTLYREERREGTKKRQRRLKWLYTDSGNRETQSRKFS